jgi:anti-sigma B factor antagonist
VLKINVGNNGTYYLEGRLDAAQVDTARAQLDRVTESVVIDLTDLQYISSAGLGMFIAIHTRLNGLGKTLRLKNPNHMVKNVFRLSRLDQLISID